MNIIASRVHFSTRNGLKILLKGLPNKGLPKRTSAKFSAWKKVPYNSLKDIFMIVFWDKMLYMYDFLTCFVYLKFFHGALGVYIQLHLVFCLHVAVKSVLYMLKWSRYIFPIKLNTHTQNIIVKTKTKRNRYPPSPEKTNITFTYRTKPPRSSNVNVTTLWFCFIKIVISTLFSWAQSISKYL